MKTFKDFMEALTLQQRRKRSIVAKKKAKAFSNFAFKGVVGTVAAIYLVLFGLSFWKINQYDKQLANFDSVMKKHALISKANNKITKELTIIKKSLNLSGSITSNKKVSYRVLAQIAASVPKRVRFQSITLKGVDSVVIQGDAFSDQDILNLVANLNKQKLIRHASLTSMSLSKSSSAATPQMKGFRIACTIGAKS